MSDPERDVFASASLQNRRLRMRHSSFNNSVQLSYGSTESTSSPIDRPRLRGRTALLHASPLLPPAITELLHDNDDDWVSDNAVTPNGDDISGQSVLTLDSNKKHHRKRSSLATPITPARRRGPSRGTSPSPNPSYLHVHSGGYHRRGRSSDARENRYIDYLEKQVADLTTQLQGYTSTASNSNHAAKMRKLSNENKTLRHDIEQWETQFIVRVNEEVEARQSTDRSLRDNLEVLQAMLVDAEHYRRVTDLEIKDLHKKCNELNGVEEQNRNLEFRIEALSDLLADSTRAIQTPPAVASNANTITTTTTTPTRPRRYGSLGSIATSIATTAKCSGVSDVFGRQPSGSICGSIPGDTGIPDSINGDTNHLYNFDQNYYDRPSSCGSQISSSSSRRSTMFPQYATPMSRTSSSQMRSRRMRRFPSGSSAPKTLILPSAVAVSASPSPALVSPPEYSSRPVSAHSTTSENNLSRSLEEDDRRFSTFSLFAELARAESDCSNDTPPIADSEKVKVENTVSTPPSSMSQGDAQGPRYRDTHDFVADGLSHPIPSVVKALETIINEPSLAVSTLSSARRKALDIFGRVVGQGIGRVSYRRAYLLATTIRERRRSSISYTARGTRGRGECKECGAARPGRGDIRNSIDWQRRAFERSSMVRNPIRFAMEASQQNSTSTQQKLSTGDESLDTLGLWLIRFILTLILMALGVAVRDVPASTTLKTRPSSITSSHEEEIDDIKENEREKALRKLERTSLEEVWLED